jgi:hypothetical protein
MLTASHVIVVVVVVVVVVVLGRREGLYIHFIACHQ